MVELTDLYIRNATWQVVGQAVAGGSSRGQHMAGSCSGGSRGQRQGQQQLGLCNAMWQVVGQAIAGGSTWQVVGQAIAGGSSREQQQGAVAAREQAVAGLGDGRCRQ